MRRVRRAHLVEAVALLLVGALLAWAAHVAPQHQPVSRVCPAREAF